MTPLVLAVIATMFAAGRVLLEHQQVIDAASTAVQAASIAPSPGSAKVAGLLDATAVLESERAGCSPLEVVTNTSSFAAGGSVEVSMTCRVALAHLAFGDLPGHVLLGAAETAALEPYRQLGR